MAIPTPTPITLDSGLTSSATAKTVFDVVEAKFNDAQQWSLYAAGLVESKLTAINGATDAFDISTFLTAAEAAIAAIPDPPALGALSFTAPTLRGTIAALPAPTAHTAGAAPATAITFTNSDFSDSLLTALRAKLEADIASASTGLGDAEAALFARETARQNAARALAYTEVSTQFSARGFELPPGALLAKQTEMNNESGIRLTDSSTGIMAESARLAQEWNKTTISAATQLLDVISKVFDSKVMRDFEASKNEVMLSIEGYKASISEVVAAAELEAKYITAVADGNKSLASMLSADASAQGDYVQAQGQRNSAEAAGYDVLSRKAIAVAGLARDTAMSNIDAATRKYAADINVLQSSAQAAMQLVAASLNSVSVGSNLDWRGAYSYTNDQTAVATPAEPPPTA